MTDWQNNLPPGTLSGDESPPERRDEEADDAFWNSWWAMIVAKEHEKEKDRLL